MPIPPVTPPPPPAKPAPGFHGAVTEFKRRLIEATLFQLDGNRTRTARALGLQRTYLLRLIREFGVNVPHREAPPRRAAARDGGRPKDVDTRRAPV
jgi:DNA-binding NtrC family response regulator